MWCWFLGCSDKSARQRILTQSQSFRTTLWAVLLLWCSFWAPHWYFLFFSKRKAVGLTHPNWILHIKSTYKSRIINSSHNRVCYCLISLFFVLFILQFSISDILTGLWHVNESIVLKMTHGQNYVTFGIWMEWWLLKVSVEVLHYFWKWFRWLICKTIAICYGKRADGIVCVSAQLWLIFSRFINNSQISFIPPWHSWSSPERFAAPWSQHRELDTQPGNDWGHLRGWAGGKNIAAKEKLKE